VFFFFGGSLTGEPRWFHEGQWAPQCERAARKLGTVALLLSAYQKERKTFISGDVQKNVSEKTGIASKFQSKFASSASISWVTALNMGKRPRGEDRWPALVWVENWPEKDVTLANK